MRFSRSVTEVITKCMLNNQSNQIFSQIIMIFKLLIKLAIKFITTPFQNFFGISQNLPPLSLILNSRFSSRLSYGAIVWCAIALFSLSFLLPSPAQAALNDDKFDGNIFALYAGNGSLIPPRESLSESLSRNRPVLLTFYVEDSQDCKKFSGIISQLQQYYGKVAAFTPINADAIPVKTSYKKNEPGYYYSGVLPQTVILDQKGQVVFDGKGQVKYEALDDVLRKVFNLLPRTESAELKQRAFNEINTELAP